MPPALWYRRISRSPRCTCTVPTPSRRTVCLAAGWNAGLEASSGRDFLSLNADAWMTEGSLGRLVRYADAHPEEFPAGGMTALIGANVIFELLSVLAVNRRDARAADRAAAHRWSR